MKEKMGGDHWDLCQINIGRQPIMKPLDPPQDHSDFKKKSYFISFQTFSLKTFNQKNEFKIFDLLNQTLKIITLEKYLKI